MKYSYEIAPRPIELGGGWRLRLLEDREEMGGSVFPVEDYDAHVSMRWWSGCSEQERAHWMKIAGSMQPTDAHYAFMLAEAYAEAEATAYEWLDARDNS